MDVSFKIESEGEITTSMIEEKVGEDFGLQLQDLDKQDFGRLDYSAKAELDYSAKAELDYNAKAAGFFKTKVLMFVENKFEAEIDVSTKIKSEAEIAADMIKEKVRDWAGERLGWRETGLAIASNMTRAGKTETEYEED